MKNRVGRSALDEPAVVQVDALRRASALRLAEVVRAHHERRARGGERPRSAPRPRARRPGRGSRSARRGTALGPQRPGARQREALLLAARERARRPLARARASPTRSSASRARARARAGGTPRQPERVPMFASAEQAQQERALEHHRLAPAARGAPIQRTRPSSARCRPCSSAQQRALARAVGADEGDARSPAVDARASTSLERAHRAERTRSAASRSAAGGRARLSHAPRRAHPRTSAQRRGVEQRDHARAARGRARARAAGRPCSSRARSSSS